MPLKKMISPLVPQRVKDVRRAVALMKLTDSICERECPACGFVGNFLAFGHPPRIDALCPACNSLERHRLLLLALSRGEIGFSAPESELSMLHFAPEGVLKERFQATFGTYVTADLFRDDVDKRLNMEEIEEPDGSYDVVVASHILEHVDDFKASCEIRRILRAGGLLIAMVPMIEGWDTTYENEGVRTDEDRLKHFGQEDHVRYYGADFPERIERSGLTCEKQIAADGEDCLRYSLIRGEKIFLFRKAN
ncbi:MAG: methyltransferase domain-containing protein [Acidobacteriota bacterium]